ncbi:flagellar type III secretion system pore protein FliP [Mycolicibacterium sp.]|uniref:flagellar type III secretion system pore protein FliP n=1 Tax=Mycolicibacterium sp. TaxID=2320850 RepID=UPI0025EEAD04|nr:flagellar type III secretion system pore protein FliP [Mycolicibacterium sp.]
MNAPTMSLRRLAATITVLLTVLVAAVLLDAAPASAQQVPTATSVVSVDPTASVGATPATPGIAVDGVTAPAAPTSPTGAGQTPGAPALTLQLPTETGGVTSQPLTIVLLLTLIALAPSMLLLMTSFTRIAVVLSLTRNALSLPSTPPNAVLVGLSLFLTLFIMGPVLKQANQDALQPYLKGEITQEQAFQEGIEPFREFMLSQVRESDLELFMSLSSDERPANASEVPTTVLVPAYVISELRAAFLLGFVIFIPFLVIDIVVSSTLMSMGMVMLPPVAISLPFKLLLFVVVDGWQLTVGTLVSSFRT